MRSTLAVIVSGIAVAGCGSTLKPTAQVTHVSAEAVVLERLAILPVISAEGLEGFRLVAADKLAAAVTRARPQTAVIHVLAGGSSPDLFNDAELTDSSSQVLANYRTTGRLDKGTLAEMGEAFRATHLLHMRARYWERSRTKDVVQTLETSAYIWSTTTEGVVWEASVTIERPVNEELERRRPMPELLEAACRELASRLP